MVRDGHPSTRGVLPLELRSDSDEDEEIDQVSESSGLPEESSEERMSAKRSFFPSSMGLGFFVAAEAENLPVTVRWGDYRRASGQREALHGRLASGAGATHADKVPLRVLRSGQSMDSPLQRTHGQLGSERHSRRLNQAAFGK